MFYYIVCIFVKIEKSILVKADLYPAACFIPHIQNKSATITNIYGKEQCSVFLCIYSST